MFANYLKSALRNLSRYKTYSAINIFGLAFGLTAVLLLSLHVFDEFTFDRYHSKSDNIYRLLLDFTQPGQATQTVDSVTGALAPAMAAQLVEVEAYAQLFALGRADVTYQQNEFYEPFLAADPRLFEMFDFEFIQGDPVSSLAGPDSVVITEDAAARFFGNEDPMGKVLESLRGNFQVTAVVADFPPNSHLQFDVFFSAPGFFAEKATEWDDFDAVSYLLLNPNTDLEALEARIAELVQANVPAPFNDMMSIRLQALTDIHFGSAGIQSNVSGNSGQVNTVLTLAAIAFFILFIACINYINLATARAMSRAGEIGVRKVIGAQRRQLLLQFLSESIILTLIAFAVALFATWLLLPLFNGFTGKSLSLGSMLAPSLSSSIVLFAIVVGIAAGAYPAVYLANTRILAALQGKEKASRASLNLRKGLVVAQFCLSVILLVATFVAIRQMDFISARSLGFDPENIVVMDINSGASRGNFQAIKNELLSSPGVESVSVTSRVPGEWKNIVQLGAVAAGQDASEAIRSSFMGVDQDFFATFGVDLVAGRNYSGAESDANNVIINQQLARMLNWDDPVGQQLQLVLPQGDIYPLTVIGVAADYHFRSLHEPIGPLVLGAWNNPIQAIDYFSAKISGENMPATLVDLENAQGLYDPDTPFEFHFLEEQIAIFYESDELTTALFGIAAAIAVLIACLGLYGLSTFATLQRSKEIGIRKILGATVAQIITLLSLDFIKLILLANLIAWPVVFYLMNLWLNSFAYHTAMSLVSFLLAALLLVIVTFFTVSGHAFRVAMANPVDSIRYE